MGLTKEQQKAIEAIAVPIEAGRAVRSHVGAIRTEEGFRYQAYWGKQGGRVREYVGPLFRYPRDAMSFVDALNERAGLGA
jgi:hypothetical protein